MVSRADVVILSEYQGYVSSGVHDDCRKALELGVPVYLIRRIDSQNFSLHKLVSLEKLVNNTLNHYSKAKVKILKQNFELNKTIK